MGRPKGKETSDALVGNRGMDALEVAQDHGKSNCCLRHGKLVTHTLACAPSKRNEGKVCCGLVRVHLLGVRVEASPLAIEVLVCEGLCEGKVSNTNRLARCGNLHHIFSCQTFTSSLGSAR